MLILQLIRDGSRRNGYSPTLQELADELGVSKVTIFEHVEELEKRGLLRRSAHKARSLEVTSRAAFPDESATKIPLVGFIAAGAPIEAIEDRETLDLETLFDSRKGTYVLQVRGNSMIEDQICDGDFVIIEKRETARNGETVVALVDDGEATLKRFYKEKNRIRLQPANSSYKPIYVKNCTIQGIVIGVLRNLRN
jgi:repressor LexA